MVRWASRGIQSDALHAQATIENETIVVTVDAFDSAGNLVNYEGIEAHLESPDSTADNIVMVQNSSGEYEGRFTLRGRESYLLTVASKEGADQEALHLGLDFSKLPEDRDLSGNEAFLRRLAQVAANRNDG
jgi:hypothetical protein